MRGDPVEPEPQDFDDLDRLVARELLTSIRDEVLAGYPPDDRHQAYYRLKWPADLSREPASDAEVQRALGISRAELRTVRRHIQDRVVYVLHRRIGEEGWDPAEAAQLLAEYFALVDRLTPPDAAGAESGRLAPS